MGNGIEAHFGVPSNEIVGMAAAEYAPTVIDKVCGGPPPRGVFCLLEVDGSLAGMCGLRFVRAGLAEAKRIYVRPAYRGKRLGELLLQRVQSDAVRKSLM